MPTNTPVGTLYRRALRRVERRAFDLRMDRTPERLELLREAVRTCNTLARMLPPARGRRED